MFTAYVLCIIMEQRDISFSNLTSMLLALACLFSDTSGQSDDVSTHQQSGLTLF